MENPHDKNSEEKFNPPETVTLQPGKEQRIQGKLSEYVKRLVAIEERIPFIAPEIFSAYAAYYNTLAKVETANQLLIGVADLQAVEESVLESIVIFWKKMYPEQPSSVKSVLKEHMELIKYEIASGWKVVQAYNFGREDLLR